MVDESRPRLGRGLAALIGDVGSESESVSQSRGQKKVPIEFLRPNPKNPRKTFPDETLQELASSIKERGVIQPIVVRAQSGVPDVYEIIAGERRWRASQKAGLHEVPIVVADVSERDSLEMAIIENVQREDLNAIDEAHGYEQLAGEFGYTQNDLAKIIGKSRSHIANTLRLLKLPASVRNMVADGTLSAGHGRALLTSEQPEFHAKQILDQEMSVRDAERLVQPAVQNDSHRKQSRKRQEKDADTRALERALAEVLGMGVAIKHRGEKGELSIKYASLEQLDALCKRLRN